MNILKMYNFYGMYFHLSHALCCSRIPNLGFLYFKYCTFSCSSYFDIIVIVVIFVVLHGCRPRGEFAC